MPHPPKPWSDGQQHELYSGKVFQYSASNNRWVRITSSSNVSDSQLDSELANVKAERDSDLTYLNTETVLVSDVVRLAETSNGMRMTNIGAFDKDDSDNFLVFGTNKLKLAANGDSNPAVTIHESQDVEFHGNIIGYTSKAEHDSDLNNLNGDYGTY